MAVAGVRKDKDPVFCDGLGDFLSSTSSERYAYQRVLKRAGIPHHRFHDLRHTTPTLLLEQGKAFIEVSALLGRSTIAITADIYGHVTGYMEQGLATARDGILRRKTVS
jgi:integrase